MSEENKGTIRTKIETYLTSVRSATFGEQVRGAIYDALRTIANECDDDIANTHLTVNTTLSNMGNATTLATDAAASARSAAETLNDFRNLAQTIDNAVANYLSIHVNETDYIQNQNTGSWTAPAPVVAWNEETNRWEYTFTRAPQFKRLQINRLLDSTGAASDSVAYDPNTGALTLNIVDKLYNLQVSANSVNHNFTGDLAVFGYDGSRPYLRISVPRGMPGDGAQNFQRRPFILNDLYVTGAAQFQHNANNPPYFSRQSLVSRDSVIDQDTERATTYGANDFDAAIIIFRKSVDNSTGNTLNRNFVKKTANALLKNNVDYDSTVSVFLPKGGQATAAFVDAQGRTFTRRVRWLTEPWYLVLSGGAKNTWPTAKLTADSDYTTGKKAETYSNAFLFENAKYGTKGDAVEWSWQSAGTYKNTKLKGSKCNPATNIANNKMYNQFLIPERIIGIRFLAEETLVNHYVGPVSTGD